MSTKTYLQVKHKITPLERLTQLLRMVNGNIINPLGCWKGMVELGGIKVAGSFEVFDSSGGWEFLFGKHLMTAFSVVHDYATDEVYLPARQCTLRNQYNIAIQPQIMDFTAQTQKMRKTKEGNNVQFPLRGVPIDHHHMSLQIVDTPTPAETLQHMNAIIWEQQSINGEQWVEEHVTIMGDRKKFPLR